jgi:nitrogen regulatory protein PII
LPVVHVVAIVKPFRARAILDALAELPVQGGTVREVMGFGRQKQRLHRYLGGEYSSSFVPKVELSFFVESGDLPAVTRVIIDQARTGRIGDGKILVLPCRDEHVSW